MSPNLLGVALGTLVVLIGGSAILVLNRDPTFADCRQSVVAGGAGAIGGPFTLVDENGATVTDKQVITEPSLVYFGYTYCPDVCPIDSARNAEATDLLAAQGISVTPVFITIDPARDTPEVMKTYTDYMHPKMLGLTGTDAQIAEAAAAYRVLYSKNGEGDDYLMSHTNMTYLVLPGHGYVDFYRSGEPADVVAKSVACYAARA
jgi:protein SCO1/2